MPVIGPEPVNPSAMPQAGVQGSFRFNAGKVGSAGRNKAKKRHGDLSNLQKQLEQQRAKFLQWHQQELNRAKARTPPHALSQPQMLSDLWCEELAWRHKRLG